VYSKLKNILYTDTDTSQEKWGIFNPILCHILPKPIIWQHVILLRSSQEEELLDLQLLDDDSQHVGLNPQQWCHRRHRPNKDYLAAGAAGVAGAAAFVSALAGALSSLLAGLATTAVAATGTLASTLTSALGAAGAGAAGAATAGLASVLAGSAAKAVAANRPTIRVAIVFILNFLLD